LVELGQSVTLRVEDHHDGGVRDVDPDFDHGRRGQDVDLVVREESHDPLFFSGFHSAVDQPDLVL